jgi:intracellular multiplication protein IcmP
MAKGQGGGNEGGSNIEMVYLVAVLLVVLLAWAVWTYAKAWIVLPAFAIDYAIIWLIEHTKGLNSGGEAIKEYVTTFFNGKRDAANPLHVPWETFSQVRQLVGGQVKWVVAGLIACIAIYTKMNMRGEGYQRMFSLAGGKKRGPSFAQYQSDFWRVATYSAQFDPDNRDKDIAPQLTPPEWLRKNDIKFEDNELDHDTCRAAFAEQLGKSWHGFERATLNVKVVLIICALHYLKTNVKLNGEDVSVSLLERQTLSIAWAGGKDGTPAMKALVEKYGKDASVRRVIDMIGAKHGFENTVAYGILDRARAKTGVLKETDMLYIKKLDRHLWYGLNNCGRKRFHTEGAGIISHFFAERIANRALIEPWMENAVEGIEAYFFDEGIESLTSFYEIKDEDTY